MNQKILTKTKSKKTKNENKKQKQNKTKTKQNKTKTKKGLFQKFQLIPMCYIYKLCMFMLALLQTTVLN